MNKTPYLSRIVFLLLSAFLCPAWGLDPHKSLSQYIHNRWGLEQGLPQISVQTIAQTPDGYIWLGTQEGLVRFDGARMRVYDQTNTPVFIKSYIHHLLVDSQQTLWIATKLGIYAYRDGVFSSLSGLDGAPSGRVFQSCEAADGSVWFATDSGAYRLHEQRFQRFTTQDGLPDDLIRVILRDRDDRLWLGAENGLVMMDGGEPIIFNRDSGLNGDRIYALYQSSDHRIWIGTDKGLSFFEDGRFKNYTEEDGLTANDVLALTQDRDGVLWVGTSAGVSRFHEDRFLENPANPREKNQIYALMEDWEGSLWLGTWTEGLQRYRDGFFTCFGEPEGLPAGPVRAVLRDSSDTLWFGTNQGLARLSQGTTSVIDDAIELNNNVISTLMEDSSGALWIGTRFGGLSQLLNNETRTFTTEQGLSSHWIRVLYEDRQGGIWIGTDSTGVDLFQKDRFFNYSVKEGLSSNTIYSITEDQDGHIWLGTSGRGINILKDGVVEVVTTENGLAGSTIYCFYRDDQEDIWIGTDLGLTRCRNNVFKSVRVSDGLFNDTAYKIIEDDSGLFWVSCNKGIYSVSKQELNRFLDGSRPSVVCRAYDMSDGMRSHECNFGGGASGARTPAGQLWFPTVKGAVLFDPGKVKKNRLPPPVLIDRILAGDKDLGRTPPAEFGPGLDNLEINYTALSFLEPNKVEFRYILEGWDKRWTEAGNRRVAHYHNLFSGDYTFKVMACNNDGVWNLEGASFSFKVLPHYYETWWFYTLIGLTILLFFFIGFWLRTRTLRARKAKLRAVVASKTQALVKTNKDLVETREQLIDAAHQAGRAETAANVLHDIGNALNSVNVNSSLIDKNVRDLKIDFFVRLVELLNGHRDDLASFLANDERGRNVLSALERLSVSLYKGREKLLDRVKTLENQILRLNDIIRAQRIDTYIKPFQELVMLNKLLNELLSVQAERPGRKKVRIVREYQPLPPITTQKTKLTNVLVNLLDNAFDAAIDCETEQPAVRIVTRMLDEDRIAVDVSDNGSGIDPSKIKHIFFHGFSTKQGRDGFGLHYSANAIREMSGELQVISEGPGKGATFTLIIPIKTIETSEDKRSAKVIESEEAIAEAKVS